VYILDVMNIENYMEKEQKQIQKLVAEKFPQYYLTGGTALAFYFKHRHSEDLDFFTQKYSSQEAGKIMEYIAKETGYKYELTAEQQGGKLIPMRVYEVDLKNNVKLKVDIVQDPYKNIKSPENGLHSVEDIYCRKIQISLNPVLQKQDEVGRVMSGSRQVVKDVYDLYYLSENFMNLSDFYLKHFSPQNYYRLDSWYRSLNKMRIKMDLLDMNIKKDVFRVLDKEIIHKLSQDLAIQKELDQDLGL
jgi:hypothetical protein